MRELKNSRTQELKDSRTQGKGDFELRKRHCRKSLFLKPDGPGNNGLHRGVFFAIICVFSNRNMPLEGSKFIKKSLRTGVGSETVHSKHPGFSEAGDPFSGYNAAFGGSLGVFGGDTGDGGSVYGQGDPVCGGRRGAGLYLRVGHRSLAEGGVYSAAEEGQAAGRDGCGGVRAGIRAGCDRDAPGCDPAGRPGAAGG